MAPPMESLAISSHSLRLIFGILASLISISLHPRVPAVKDNNVLTTVIVMDIKTPIGIGDFDAY